MAIYDVPLDSELQGLVCKAVQACNRLVLELENDGRHIGSYGMGFPLTVKSSEHGWPSVSTAFIGDGPTDFGRAFSPNGGTFSPFAYDEVPELSTAIAYMLADSNLVNRLNDGASSTVDDFTKMGAGIWVTGILDRVRHTVGSEFSDGEIADLYLEVEPTLFLDRLPIDVVVPVVLTSFDVEDAVDVAPRLRIERMTDEFNRARYLDQGWNHDVNPLVANSATHALVFSDWDMPWPNIWYHQESHWPVEVVDRAFRAIELAAPGVTAGYAQILIRPVGWARRWRADLPPLLKVPASAKYQPSLAQNADWNKPGTHVGSQHLAVAGAIFERLTESAKPVTIATRRLGTASLRDGLDDRVIDLCIALEALCGDRGEVTYKLKMRVAALLTITGRTEGRTTRDLTNAVKRIYELRSRLVHGDDFGKYGTVSFNDGSSIDSVTLLTQLVRSSVLAVLDRPDLGDMEALDQTMIEAMRPSCE